MLLEQDQRSAEQPAIKWEEEALEVLHDRAQIRLDLYFGSTTILQRERPWYCFASANSPSLFHIRSETRCLNIESSI